MTEHDTAGDLLQTVARHNQRIHNAARRLCQLSDTLIRRWPRFEADLHQHIHLENNILFPRAVEMEETSAPDFYKSAGEFNEHRCFGH